MELEAANKERMATHVKGFLQKVKTSNVSARFFFHLEVATLSKVHLEVWYSFDNFLLILLYLRDMDILQTSSICISIKLHGNPVKHKALVIYFGISDAFQSLVDIGSPLLSCKLCFITLSSRS